MNQLHQRLAQVGIAIPNILLPKENVDMEAWAVIACDQYTQDPKYWEQVESRVGKNPSTLRMILPELYLENADRQERITGIRATMEAYLQDAFFREPISGCVYLERSTPYHPSRGGLVLMVDLDRYDWDPCARPLIRSTEGTIKERIPPRMEIRRGAPLELPHILLLIDDMNQNLIEGLGRKAKKHKPLYETSLMLGSGYISGWALTEESDWLYLAEGLEGLIRQQAYGTEHEEPFLFAVGDGNHSLATAKAVWEEYKDQQGNNSDLQNHPARWALVEVENIYDQGISFEPIHRVLFDTKISELRDALSVLPDFSFRLIQDPGKLTSLVSESATAETRYGLVSKDACALVSTSASGVATFPLQPILDRFITEGAGTDRCIDYIHGSEECFRVAKKDNAVSILLPPVGKADLFSTVARSGPLPRKSFSMGEGIEKRFYLECRSLFR